MGGGCAALRVFLFDIDGTLTPHRQHITKEFLGFFTEWARENKFYLTTGSDFAKIQEQLPAEILNLAAGLFCCMGNQLIIPQTEEIIYQNSYNPTDDLIKTLDSYLDSSDYPHPWRSGPHIEHRVGMINFTIAGRGSDAEMREIYSRFDQKCGERERMRAVLMNMYPEIDVSIGGKISLDICPRGNDKSQSVRYVAANEKSSYIIFLGDRAFPGGNDYAAAREIDNMPRGLWFNVNNWKETQAILKLSNLYINKDGGKA